MDVESVDPDEQRLRALEIQVAGLTLTVDELKLQLLEVELARKRERTFLEMVRQKAVLGQKDVADLLGLVADPFAQDGPCPEYGLAAAFPDLVGWFDRQCTQTMIVSATFKAAREPEEFLKRNLEIFEHPVEHRLPVNRRWSEASDPETTAIVCVYPSGAVRTVPGRAVREGDDLLVVLPDQFTYIDPDRDPASSGKTVRCPVGLFAVPYEKAPVPSEPAGGKRQGGALLHWKTLGGVATKDFNRGPVVILIHDFTAGGRYLRELARLLHDSGFNPMIYGYDSSLGIERAAKTLDGVLLDHQKEFGELFGRVKILLVGHGLGGLVARAAALRRRESAPVAGVAMLGSPNNGILSRSSFLRCLIDYGESLGGAMPQARGAACLSALELMKKDGPAPYLDRLNAQWAKEAGAIPALTIAGGKKNIEVGKGPLKNWLANCSLQLYLGGASNDGLVSERSVQLGGASRHENAYPEYGRINHAGLAADNAVGQMLAAWLKNR